MIYWKFESFVHFVLSFISNTRLMQAVLYFILILSIKDAPSRMQLINGQSNLESQTALL